MVTTNDLATASNVRPYFITTYLYTEVKVLEKRSYYSCYTHQESQIQDDSSELHLLSVFLGQDDLVFLIYQNYFYKLRYCRENGLCGMKVRRHFFVQVAS